MSARLFEVPICTQQCLACGRSTQRDFFDFNSGVFEWGGHWYCNLQCFQALHADRPVMVEYVNRVISKEKDMDSLASMFNGMNTGAGGMMMAS